MNTMLTDDLATLLEGKTVLVTGGTGSFGSSFVRHVLAHYNPEKVIVFSRDELKQHEMRASINDDRIRFFLGDVRDLERLKRAFTGVDIVVHAAALKQVPALEYNPQEAIKTNIIGSQNVTEAAIDCGVSKVLLISTDKAAQPVNLYGASKLCAEKLFIASNSYARNTKFSVVRYGNVIGSRGSLVEMLLQKQDAAEVTLTDSNMTRFWITLPQSFRLVLFALANMEGGELFVPKVPSMKIVDVMKVCTPNARHQVIGIRPGEKVHEILLTSPEARRAYDIGEYFVVLPEFEFQAGHYGEKYRAEGSALDDYFEYTSDNNPQWLTHEDLREIAREVLASQ